MQDEDGSRNADLFAIESTELVWVWTKLQIFARLRHSNIRCVRAFTANKQTLIWEARFCQCASQRCPLKDGHCLSKTWLQMLIGRLKAECGSFRPLPAEPFWICIIKLLDIPSTQFVLGFYVLSCHKWPLRVECASAQPDARNGICCMANCLSRMRNIVLMVCAVGA